MLSPRGSMRWDTDGQGLLPLQPAPEPPPDPWLQKQGGAGASTGPRRAASQDLAEPRATSFNLATADEHRRRKRKHCQVIGEKTRCSIPVPTPRTLPYLTVIRLPGTSLNPIHWELKRRERQRRREREKEGGREGERQRGGRKKRGGEREFQFFSIHKTKCSPSFWKYPWKQYRKFFRQDQNNSRCAGD